MKIASIAQLGSTTSLEGLNDLYRLSRQAGLQNMDTFLLQKTLQTEISIPGYEHQ
jgi:hypothetical protein